MGYEPKGPPKPITSLTRITNKRDRMEVEALLSKIAGYKALQKEAKEALDTNKETGEIGLNEQAVGILQSYGIEKTSLNGFIHTILNGTNSSISQGNVKKTLLDRIGQEITVEMIEDILGEVVTLTPYTTIVTTKAKDTETGAVTGEKVRTGK